MLSIENDITKTIGSEMILKDFTDKKKKPEKSAFRSPMHKQYVSNYLDL